MLGGVSAVHHRGGYDSGGYGSIQFREIPNVHVSASVARLAVLSLVVAPPSQAHNEMLALAVHYPLPSVVALATGHCRLRGLELRQVT